MRICKSCREEYAEYKCVKCRRNPKPDHCPECHAELAHGSVPGPSITQSRGGGGTSGWEQDRQYNGDNSRDNR